MKGNFWALCIGIAAAGMATAEPVTPERGSALRSELLDTMRVQSSNDLGAPLEFVVNTLLVEGDRAFAMLSAQRPGGAAIDISQTPMVLRDQIPEWAIDGPEVVGFMYREAGNWYVEEYSVGATDVWWSGGPFCRNYASLLPAQACR